MEPSHYDRDASAAVIAGNLVGPFGSIGFHRNGYQVGGFVKRDGFHAVVIKLDFNIRRGEARDRSRRQRFHLPGFDIFLSQLATHRWLNQG
jgi:hypothetical protein